MIYQTCKEIHSEKKKKGIHNLESILILQNLNLISVTETFLAKHWEKHSNWPKKTKENAAKTRTKLKVKLSIFIEDSAILIKLEVHINRNNFLTY